MSTWIIDIRDCIPSSSGCIGMNFPIIKYTMSYWLRTYNRELHQNQLFKSNSHFTEGVDITHWWSCSWKGLRLQPTRQACFTVLFLKIIYIIIILKFLWKQELIRKKTEQQKRSVVLMNVHVKLLWEVDLKSMHFFNI